MDILVKEFRPLFVLHIYQCLSYILPNIKENGHINNYNNNNQRQCVYPCWGLRVALYIACMLVSIGSRSQRIDTEAVTKALS